jgi:Na+-transporting methylmalonyl-CoA/oxaloacetate decarboxylase gamma subunit
MGVNNKARRAAKRRRQRSATQHRSFAGNKAPTYDEAAQRAEQERDLRQRLALAIRAVVQGHWTPTDLAEITRRALSAHHVPLVAALVAEETDRHPASTIAPAWRGELDAMGPRRAPDLGDAAEAQRARAVLALLLTLPRLAETIPPPGATTRSRLGGDSGAPSAALAKVRALLAKAESTEFPAEAEALTAKAQQLIATYALDRHTALLDAPAPERDVAVRRLWVDPPYVVAKALLVDAVAAANHCRAVLSTQLGFVTLVGHAPDLDATELLVTSLQVQADRAMLRPGRVDEPRGRSRTRSFRRSFLVSYSRRIGERLRHTVEETMTASSRSRELVPVMARNDERVRAATEELFPELVTRRTRISNAQGWVAGRAAADLADFGIRRKVTDQAAS